jgi:hypothetical protein
MGLIIFLDGTEKIKFLKKDKYKRNEEKCRNLCPEDGSSTFVLKVSEFVSDYTSSYPRKLASSNDVSPYHEGLPFLFVHYNAGFCSCLKRFKTRQKEPELAVTYARPKNPPDTRDGV